VSSSLGFEVYSSALADQLLTVQPSHLKRGLAHALGARVDLPAPNFGDFEGTVVELHPADSGLKSKDIPFEQFIGKSQAVRDNLRVLEQKINGNDGLSSLQKMEFQLLITRAQASVLHLFGEGLSGGRNMPVGEEADVMRRCDELTRWKRWNGLILGQPALGDRWHGGSVSYGNGQCFEPVEFFFLRLAFMRERLFELDAALNACLTIEASDRDMMSKYILRSFGSLTTFNLLFADRADYFSSKA